MPKPKQSQQRETGLSWEGILRDPARQAQLEAGLESVLSGKRRDARNQHFQLALRDFFLAIANGTSAEARDFPRMVARELADAFDGLTRGYSHPIVKPVAKKSGSRTWPALRRTQIAGLAYIESAKLGSITDAHPVKTVSDCFGVSRRLLRYWKRGAQDEVGALLATHKTAPALTLAHEMRVAARSYRRWRAVDQRTLPGETRPTRRAIGSGRLDRKE
jgi:transposase-like protein